MPYPNPQREIRMQLRDQFGFTPDPEKSTSQEPVFTAIPDGRYSMHMFGQWFVIVFYQNIPDCPKLELHAPKPSHEVKEVKKAVA